MWLSWSRNLRLIFAARTAGRRSFRRVVRLAMLYQDLDNQMEVFRRKSKIKCFKGCGRCCENSFVETTVLEMIPLAAELWRRNRAEEWLQKDVGEHKRGVCPFYAPDPQIKGNGRCTIYPLRPLICRMFAFSGRRDKSGQKVYVTCERIKAEAAALYDEVSRSFDVKQPPLMGNFSSRRESIAGETDGQLYPLPVAVKKAIMRVGFDRQIKNMC